ncbi:ATP-binding protein [Caulobacter segnis]|uniref:chemotaxis protein CheA n=1 Tax=Caulobacter segnis TaxID=88688 RepID=UPI002410091D|nr:ATP-binding protein [Caulobacter segnis]MDG2522124.1 ATP-binding protein [Caulobacter segnis]
MDALLEQFLIEGRDQRREAARALERLSVAADDAHALEACFRAVHTLKGSTGLFDLAPMGQMLHVAEDRLEAARKTGLLQRADQLPLLRIVDLIEDWLEHLAAYGALPADAAERAADAGSTLTRAGRYDDLTRPGVTRIHYVPREDAYFAGDDPLAIIKAVPHLTALRISLRDQASGALYDPFHCRLVLDAASSAPPEVIAKALALVADQVDLTTSAMPEAGALEAASLEPGAPEARSPESQAARTVRLSAERLDEMARLTEELTAARNGLMDLARQVEHLPGGHDLASGLSARLGRVDRLSEELRAVIGQARLVPLSGLLERLPRVVRSLSQTLNKPAALTLSGGALELDRSVVDGLFDPLLHILRNAMDHGLEPASERAASGKPQMGALHVVARRQAGEVAIDIKDDGAGVNLGAIRARAVARGVLDARSADQLDPDALLELIFHPGFTTARTAGAISGRGVGMDAVRAAIAQLGGRVQVRSTTGQGTTITLIMPASIMLTPLALVVCGQARYAVPLAAVERSARIDSGQAADAVHLADLVGAQRRSGSTTLTVLQLQRGALLVVDGVIGRLDAAVKPLTGLMAGAPGFVGSVTTADGLALLVLDVESLAR